MPHRRVAPQESYAEEEPFLEVEVHSPQTQRVRHNNGSEETYTDYEVVCRTNLPGFSDTPHEQGRGISAATTGATVSLVVRRRYSDFEFFKKCLGRETALLNMPHVAVPSLPGKTILQNRFSASTIEERCRGLDRWLRHVAGHPLLQSRSQVLVRFLRNEKFIG
ncbi:hypothetical protein DAKH74_057330 [Maudiozyma humilis]|uniref:Sorting nexin-3 n=1 Tax=Maudiozyma humilis TaxID=51915 RepID=A0AAV5S5S9_MAUHU|nr:hypothetical protein DAKH74_057330 [Kazachstania humilis]